MNNELLTLLKKRQEDANKEATMSLVASGVAEALSGDTGGSIAGYGEQLAQSRLKRGEQFEDIGIKLQTAKDSKQIQNDKKRYQQSAVQMPDGSIKLMSYDTAMGTWQDPEQGLLKGFSPTITKDPRTGELARVTKSDAQPVAKSISSEGVRETDLTVKEEKDLRDTQKSFDKDPLVKASRSAVSQSNRAIELLSAGNPIADEGIKTIFPRMFGEVGNLAAQEQARFAGSQELVRKFGRLKERWMTGNLTASDRSDLMEVARAMASYDRRQLSAIATNRAEAESRITGIDKDVAKSAIDPLGKTPGFSQKAIKNIRRKPIEGTVVERFVEGKMRKFKKVGNRWDEVE